MSPVDSARVPVDFARVVGGALDVDPALVVDDAGPDTLPSWTSMRHIQLVVTLEEAYRVSFDYRQIADARTIRDLRAALAAKGVELP